MCIGVLQIHYRDDGWNIPILSLNGIVINVYFYPGPTFWGPVVTDVTRSDLLSIPLNDMKIVKWSYLSNEPTHIKEQVEDLRQEDLKTRIEKVKWYNKTIGTFPGKNLTRTTKDLLRMNKVLNKVSNRQLHPKLLHPKFDEVLHNEVLGFLGGRKRRRTRKTR